MRVAVLSDIHANLPALDAILIAVGDVDRIWVLGDVVGYGPDPDGVVSRLVERDAVAVRGNHDAAAIGAIETDWFNADARLAIEWTAATITAPTRRWLATLPETRRTDGFALVHGSFVDPIWEYILDADVARASLDRLPDHGVSVGLFGHTHLPSLFRDRGGGRVEAEAATDGRRIVLDGRPTLVNPGSVGQPRDGDPRASAIVLELEDDRTTVTWTRTPYDVAAVQAAMAAARLPAWLARRLELGR